MADFYDHLCERKHPITAMKLVLAAKCLEASGMSKSDIQLCIGVINKRNEDFYADNVKRLVEDMELVMERKGLTRNDVLRELMDGKYTFDKKGRLLEQNTTVSLH